ncbi:MAG: EVE domain-containing protein [Deltaproteobacteria bacterium]|nr:EVE domain-containing protein [Deltaproteobacteria bacterium]
MKSEPFKYPWEALVKDGRTYWDGVRNYEARNNLAAMRVGDLALFYHSNEGKEVVGVAEIVKESYPDPTADDPAWVVVEIEPHTPLAKPVSLATIKADPELKEIQLIRRSRLSVVPLTATEFERILALGGTKVPKANRKRA